MSIDTLTAQAEILFLAYENVNIWGWQDSETEAYLDISTSFDELEKAINFAKETKQIAIWDNINLKKLKYNIKNNLHK